MKRMHWAFDPYNEVSETWERSIEVMGQLQKDSPGLEIIPTYFLGHDLIHWVSIDTVMQMEQLKPKVIESMNNRLKSFNGIKFTEPEVIICASSSLRSDAKIAAEYFHANSSELVILNTHARKGLGRMVLGSFSENLLLQSQTPLMFVSPNTEAIKNIDNVFYPTDFSDSGFKAFCSYIEKPAIRPSKISLYTKVISPIPTIAEGITMQANSEWTSLESYIDDVSLTRRKKSEKWKQKATAAGIPIELIVDDKPGVFVDDLLAAIKSSGSGLVVAASFATGTEAILIGSVARNLVRACEVPVLVEHHQK